MRFRYIFGEAISGFRKSKLSSFASIFVIFVTLLALGLFAMVGYNVNKLILSIKEKIEIEAFLKDGLSNSEVDSLKKVISSFQEVEDVYYVSKEEAVKIFEREFGENIFNILDFNPLPASFKIKLKEKYRNLRGVEGVIAKLKRIDEIEDIRYRRALLGVLERRFELLSRAFLVSGFLLSLISVLLVINTIRLTIYAKRKLIKTMQLVGATRGFIVSPFLIQGLLQGFIGALFSAGVIYLIVEILIPNLPDDVLSNVSMPDLFYPVLIFFGCLLGFVGSWISARKFITDKIIL
jgi:cell division transport system permease protein